MLTAKYTNWAIRDNRKETGILQSQETYVTHPHHIRFVCRGMSQCSFKFIYIILLRGQAITRGSWFAQAKIMTIVQLSTSGDRAL